MVVGQCLLGTTPRAVNDVTDKLRRAAVLKALPKTPGATKKFGALLAASPLGLR